jgi:hypothetical protein
VFLRVMFAGLVRVVFRVQVMTVRDLRVMRALLVIAGFMVLGRMLVVLGRVFVVMRCLRMVLCTLVGMCHESTPSVNVIALHEARIVRVLSASERTLRRSASTRCIAAS